MAFLLGVRRQRAVRGARSDVHQLEVFHHFHHGLDALHVADQRGPKEAGEITGRGGLPQVHKHGMIAALDDRGGAIGARDPMAADGHDTRDDAEGDEERPATQGEDAESLDDVVAQMREGRFVRAGPAALLVRRTVVGGRAVIALAIVFRGHGGIP
jgi:hypothetical protein